ncbi:hypothetical protein CSHISOI_07083 [Colletotrichum shisoi]|uniref:Uncharacterized protein n=1 Tax=Colletotrichum shisoi TaxID=2078593 RepID=A0A5Q4BMZ4_9PEZI|nr:hypothetical protein CSHISOI_07083 [Colletotrichum shisoi]
MSKAIGFMANLAGTFLPSDLVVPIGIPDKPVAETWVTVVAGAGGKNHDAGGDFPSVIVWDDNGNLIGTRNKIEGDRVKAGTEATYRVWNNKNGIKIADPHYVMLSHDNDATRISMIQVSNGQLTATFYGDTGALCGQAWYYSQRTLNGLHLKTKCVWLDADQSSGNFNARALSFHTRDMIPSHDKLLLYNSSPRWLCESTPRFSYWKNLMPLGQIVFFDPSLKYNMDSLEKGREGVNENPEDAIDKVQYDKMVFKKQGEPKKKHYRRNTPTPQRLSKRQGSNMNPEHLVLTELPGQTAREVCEDTRSVGYDIVSFVDMKYCDLSERRLYDLCSDATATNCFDANSTSFVGNDALLPRDESSAAGGPKKAYRSRDFWK